MCLAKSNINDKTETLEEYLKNHPHSGNFVPEPYFFSGVNDKDVICEHWLVNEISYAVQVSNILTIYYSQETNKVTGYKIYVSEIKHIIDGKTV